MVMEKLEAKTNEFAGRIESKIKETKPLAETQTYRGLRLFEDRVYMGPTSIKYWM